MREWNHSAKLSEPETALRAHENIEKVCRYVLGRLGGSKMTESSLVVVTAHFCVATLTQEKALESLYFFKSQPWMRQGLPLSTNY